MEIQLQQGSQEWLSFRKNHITATDVGVILGLNPWKTPYKLWQQKLDLIDQDHVNDAMIEGSKMESKALEFFNKMVESDYKPIVLVSDKYPHLMASLDGINSEGTILEIKCGVKSHQDGLNKEIPSYYYSQMQHQLLVSGADHCTYLTYRADDDYTIQHVKRDEEFIKNIIVESKKFYDCLINFTAPAMTDKDFLQKNDFEWLKKTDEYKKIKREIKRLDEKEVELRNQLVSMCDNQSCQGNGLRVSKTLTKGRIKYDDIPELKEIDVEKYRGKSTVSFRFTEI